MTKDEFETKAYEAKARSLRLTIEHAAARCAVHLQEAAPLPHGAARTELLTRARDELRAAREAIRQRGALSNALRSASLPPPSEQGSIEDAVGRLENTLAQLSPAREA